MADARRRSLERAAAQGDTEAQAALLRERERTGFEHERIVLAAHLGDPASKLAAAPLPAIFMDCPPCIGCNWGGRKAMNARHLIELARYGPIPEIFLARWAVDCVRVAAVDTNSPNDQLYRLLEDVQEWVDSDLTVVNVRLTSFINYRRRELARFGDFSPEPLIEAGFLLARAASTMSGRAEILANAVSHAYHACGNTRVARNKQINLLISHLLGDYPWR